MPNLKINLGDFRDDDPKSRVAAEAMCLGAEAAIRGDDPAKGDRLEISQNGIVAATGDYDHEDEAMDALFWKCHGEGARIGKHAAERMRTAARNPVAILKRAGDVQREIVEALFAVVELDLAIGVAETAADAALAREGPTPR